MKIIGVSGGLGNQMFQYAFYKAWEGIDESKLDITFFDRCKIHNGYELEEIFNIGNVKYASRDDLKRLAAPDSIIYRILRKCRLGSSPASYVKEADYSFAPQKVMEITGDKYLDGCWQTEEYFKHKSDVIRKEFCFKDIISDKNVSISYEMYETNSISIHVRRGDYLKYPHLYGNICSKQYYQKAIEYIKNHTYGNVKFYVFSDDIRWVKENIFFEDSCIFIDWNIMGQSYIDMQLMSLCKHNIIANSSFSWWGAWLNKNPNKIVVAPDRWLFNGEIGDVVPNDWIKIFV